MTRGKAKPDGAAAGFCGVEQSDFLHGRVADEEEAVRREIQGEETRAVVSFLIRICFNPRQFPGLRQDKALLLFPMC